MGEDRKCSAVCPKCSAVCPKCSAVCPKCSAVCPKCSAVCPKCSAVCWKCSAVCPKCNLHETENTLYPKTLCSGDSAVKVNTILFLTIEKYLKHERKLK